MTNVNIRGNTVETRHNVIGINIQLIVYYADNIVWTYSFFGKKNRIFRISIFLVDFIEKMLRIE